MTRPLEDRYLATEPELKDMLAFAMGGQVAEEVVFDEISTGAQNDLEKATQIARAMVSQYGMSEAVGPLSLGHDDQNSFFTGPKISSGTSEKIDQEVMRLLNEAHDRALAILIERRDLLDRLSALLLVTETIDGEDLEVYASGEKAIPLPEEARADLEQKATEAAAVAREADVVRKRHPAQPLMPPVPPMPAD